MFDTVADALDAFKLGTPIIVVDDEDRENEGDIVFPASLATQDKINFCATYARGLVCIAMGAQIAHKIGIQPVPTNHADPFHTAFHDSIDAVPAFGITTGISAKERAITAQQVVAENASAADFIKPGHLFPVVAKNGGLLVRKGHTEAAVDLCLLTALPPAAIICEIMDEAGDMLRRDGLKLFAQKHQLKMITIQQLVDYRTTNFPNTPEIPKTENGLNGEVKIKESNNHNAIELISSATLPTEFGLFEIKVFKNNNSNIEHVVLFMATSQFNKPFVRFHSECLTGDVFGSVKCDCKAQLNDALKKIAENGHGYLVYLKGHEGRGIGIGNKIAAYALQDQGENTYQANTSLGLPEESRSYVDAIDILKFLSINDFKFISNNPDKILALHNAGFIFEEITTPAFVTAENKKYLEDKVRLANHHLKF
jgi:3,4-dihydroxy 2-butanone 4-phosphate synthase/GTP cyclohydrolase II